MLNSAIAVLCVCAVAFLLRVLAALVKESLTATPPAVKTYMAKFNPATLILSRFSQLNSSRFHPSKSRPTNFHPGRPEGELIVINADAFKRKFPKQRGEGI